MFALASIQLSESPFTLIVGAGLAFALVVFILDLPRSVPDDGGEPVCLGCLRAASAIDHYCPHCGAAVGQLTPYIPFVYIPFYCEFFSRLWKRAWFDPDVSTPRKAGYLATIVFLQQWMLLALPWVPWQRRAAYRKRHGLCMKCGRKPLVPPETHCSGCGAPRARCPCGYDLTGNTSGVCPECGQPFEPRGDAP